MIPRAQINSTAANVAAIKAISPNNRQNGDVAMDGATGALWWFDDDGAGSASAVILVPDLGAGRWFPVAALGANAAAAAAQADATEALADAATAQETAEGPPLMQVAAATLVAGTATINTVITVAADSEVVPIQIGAITGSTNFGSLRELKSSRVNGAPSTGTIVVEAVGNDGAKDVDAAGAIRVLIFTPQA